MSDLVAHIKFSAPDTHAQIHLGMSTTNLKWMDVVITILLFLHSDMLLWSGINFVDLFKKFQGQPRNMWLQKLDYKNVCFGSLILHKHLQSVLD